MQHNARRKAKQRKRTPGERYATQPVRVAIQRACEKAGVPVFTPHQLRHLAGTLVREPYGVDVARALLGHSIASMTEIYSREVDKGLALKAVKAMG